MLIYCVHQKKKLALQDAIAHDIHISSHWLNSGKLQPEESIVCISDHLAIELRQRSLEAEAVWLRRQRCDVGQGTR